MENVVQNPTEIGTNRTGVQRSPLKDELVIESADALPGLDPQGTQLTALRQVYIGEAEPLGTVPAPATLRGKLADLAGIVTGRRAEVLIDKLSERLAFERGGTRLYDALIAKATALPDSTVDLVRLREIRAQESAHANLLAAALVRVGADPTAQTPCADLVGVQSAGLLQSVCDPRTSLAQCLSSALAAELIDCAAWDLLALLARQFGHEELAKQFDTALEEETSHLETIRAWHEVLVVVDSGVAH
jgi:bacterioferritin (cytochrome b1)